MSNALAFLLLKCRIGLGAECNICSVLSIGVALFHYVRGTLRFPWQPAVLFSFLFARSLRYFFFFFVPVLSGRWGRRAPKNHSCGSLVEEEEEGEGGGNRKLCLVAADCNFPFSEYGNDFAVFSIFASRLSFLNFPIPKVLKFRLSFSCFFLTLICFDTCIVLVFCVFFFHFRAELISFRPVQRRNSLSCHHRRAQRRRRRVFLRKSRSHRASF